MLFCNDKVLKYYTMYLGKLKNKKYLLKFKVFEDYAARETLIKCKSCWLHLLLQHKE